MTGAWNDDAITSAREDKFGRAGWAVKQAKLIDGSHAAKSSLVYGLEGPWGSGKSSVLSMIEGALADIDSKWHVVYFTPWATTTQEELFSEFFAALSSAIPSDDGYKPLVAKLSTYGKVATPLLGAVPIVGGAMAEVADRLSAKLEKPWRTVFEDLSQALRDAGLRVLVVVDDIDRLSPEELLTLLKVVRLIGRLPGIDYLLAYDEKTLAETLTAARLTQATSTTHARQFMEKIVQYPLQVPPLLESVVIRLLIDGLKDLPLTGRSVSSLRSDTFQGVLTDVMLSRLSTPRAMGRFLAQLRHVFEVVDHDEFDSCDLVLVTFMRLHFPDMHRALPTWRPELTGAGTVRTSKAALSKDPDEKDAWKHEFFETVEPVDRPDATRVAKGIFSRLAPSGGATSRSGDEGINDSPSRMENRTYFDRYIVFEVPDGDVPDGEITNALLKASGGETEPLTALVLAEDGDKSMLVVSRIDKRYRNLVLRGKTSSADSPVSVQMVKAAAVLLDSVRDQPQEFVSRRRYLTKLVATLVRLVAETASYTDIQGALDACTDQTKRIEVLWKLKNENDLSGTATSVLDQLYNKEGETAVSLVLDHMTAGDAAELNLATWTLVLVILESASAESFSEEVRSRIASGSLDLPTVASRLVQLDPSREQYVLGNGSLEQITGAYVVQAAKYVGTDGDSPLPVWTIQERREWVSEQIAAHHAHQAEGETPA